MKVSPSLLTKTLAWLMVVGLLGYAFYQQYHAQHTIHQLSTRLNDTTRQLEQLDRAIHQQQDEKAWTIDEANYLISVAHLRLHFLHDVDSAMAALMAADTHLARLQDQSLLPMRQQLSHEIGVLKTAQRVDVAAIQLRLESLAQSLAGLPLILTPKPADNIPLSKPMTATPENWRQAFERAWSEFRSLIRIRHHDGAQLIPILEVSDRQRLQQVVYTLVMQAKWAVLNRQSTIYQHSLKTLLDSLPLFLAVDDAQRIAIESDIQALLAMDIAPPLPTLTVSELSMTTAVSEENPL